MGRHDFKFRDGAREAGLVTDGREGKRVRIDSLLRDGDLKPRAIDHTITAQTELLVDDDPKKIGWYGTHVVHSDEPPTVGGDDAWPPPLGYGALAVGF